MKMVIDRKERKSNWTRKTGARMREEMILRLMRIRTSNQSASPLP